MVCAHHGSGSAIRVDTCLQGAPQDQSGMVLPFDPLNLTFHHLNYYVPLTKVWLPPSYQ